MILVLWACVLITLLTVAWAFADAILVVAATVGFLAYSVPALVGTDVTVAIGRQRPVITDASPESILAMAVGWLGYLLVLWVAVLLRGSPIATIPSQRDNDRPDASLAWGAVAVSSVLLLAMMARHGPLFFLNSRYQLSSSLGFDYLFWRWIVFLGLLFSVRAKTPIATIILMMMTLLNVIIGDRTVILLAIAAIFCLTYKSSGLIELIRRPLTWVYGGAALLVVFFAKAFYVSLKNGLPLRNAFSTTRDQNVLSYEPFGTHYILDRVIAFDVRVDVWQVAKGALGQLLLVPSSFGIDSSAFNSQITQQLFNSRLTYGIAANFWAQGYALAGYAGVLLFGMLFGWLILACQRATRTSGPNIRILLVAIAVLAGVYIHRNSLENYLSFVRQLVLSFLIVVIAAAAFRRSGGRSAARSTAAASAGRKQ